MSQPKINRSVFITGAARGLGAAIAEGFVQAGARVFLTDIDADQLEKTALGLKERFPGNTIYCTQADQADYASVKASIDKAQGLLGQIDVLINNAALGPGHVKPDFITNPIKTWEHDIALWETFMAVNATGPYYHERLLLPSMLDRGWGRIVNVSTTYVSMQKFDFYGPAKAALEVHTAILSQQLTGTGVTANIIIPGGPADTNQVTSDIGVAREDLLPPSVMVPPLLWLASDDSAAISGQRFSASQWDSALPAAEASAGSSRAAAWPELATPDAIRLPQGSNYQTR